ncbi:TIGR03986 family type III CRISPR-associated RAMP protein [Millisia brevis]|uniref:TIGR03986 family type III CRISPR-associated RAMP protein n=1 Tax=Millisia brevis TaxID=264148 RepID=UPI0008306A19|nr:TIGR03986 family CRISPR-associated RAMP protein [Millisia brevis]
MVGIPGAGGHRRRKVNAGDNFLNPYNFVSIPDREDLPAALKDGVPADHGVIAKEGYSGSIPITLTTRTPMLIPDQPRGTKRTNQPREVGTRRGRDGSVILSGSTVKGVLRSAYEAITNSRFGVFDDRHNLPGAVRSAARSALGSFPGYVLTASKNDRGEVIEAVAVYLSYLIPVGFSDNTDPMPAVWLPTNLGQAFARRSNLRDPDMQQVDAWIHLQRHPRKGFTLWRVSDLARRGEELPSHASPPPNDDWTVERYRPVRVRGIVHWTGAHFPRKHDERLVVTELIDTTLAEAEWYEEDLDEKLIRGWEGVLASYAAAHENDVDGRGRLGSYIVAQDRWELRPDRTLHMIYDSADRLHRITPAMIGRDVFDAAPADLVGAHAPASSREELSPAERVFGWVDGGSAAGGRSAATRGTKRAHRGQLRVAAPVVVRREAGEAVPPEPVPGGSLPLATLNGPKPSQYRFYAADGGGEPIIDKGEKSATTAFREGDRLRGRKFYLPHGDLVDDPEGAARYFGGRDSHSQVAVNNRRQYREHVAPRGYKPDVTTAIKDWVPAGTTFETTLYVHNLSETELGALLWLLALPEDAVYVVGLGKPLGFGATRIEANWGAVRLYSEVDLVGRYRSLSTAAAQLAGEAMSVDPQDLVNRFDRLLAQSLPAVRREFLDAVLGYSGISVHYPRVRDEGGATAPQQEGYRWWVSNDRNFQNEAPRSLPTLGRNAAPALPYLREYVSQQQPGGNRGRGPRR